MPSLSGLRLVVKDNKTTSRNEAWKEREARLLGEQRSGHEGTVGIWRNAAWLKANLRRDFFFELD